MVGRAGALIAATVGIIACSSPSPALAAFPGADGLIAFNADDTTRAVYTVTPRGKNERRLFKNAGDPSWSPSGKRIVFERPASKKGGNMEIFMARSDGTHVKRITRLPSEETEPAFSPDGKKIVFASETDGDSEIYEIGRNGSGLRQLSDLTGDDRHPSWSVNGEIVFAGPGVNAVTSAPEPHLYRFDPTTAVPPVDLGPGRDPDWSPDGQTIAFVVQLPGEPQPGGTSILQGDALMTMNRDGGERLLHDAASPTGPSNFFDPAFSPSGAAIAAGEQIASFKYTTLFRFDLATGQRTNLAAAAFSDDVTDPAWQPR